MHNPEVVAHFANAVGVRTGFNSAQWAEFVRLLPPEDLAVWRDGDPRKRPYWVNVPNPRLALVARVWNSYLFKNGGRMPLPPLSSEQQKELDALLARNVGDLIATCRELMKELTS